VLVALGESLVQLAGPYLTKEAIDYGIRHRDMGHLDRVAVLYVVALLLGLVLGYSELSSCRRSDSASCSTCARNSSATSSASRSPTFDRNPVGRVLTRVTNDVDVLNELFTSGLVSFVGDVFLLLGILVAMVRLNAELMGVAFSVLAADRDHDPVPPQSRARELPRDPHATRSAQTLSSTSI
jgi:ATP-binding cassette subfamily B protein